MLLIIIVNLHGLFLEKKKWIITITNSFKVLNESLHAPNKTWVEKGREFYNKSMKSWLQDNHAEMYSTHNEGKFVAETNIQIYHFKIRYVYTDILDDIGNKYNK